jgi:hypothetical protein
MTQAGSGYRVHLAEIRALKRRYTLRDTCAACGIIRERLPVGPLEAADNGICCVGCLSEYPELWAMSRDEVEVWLWQNWRVSLVRRGTTYKQMVMGVARTWIRVQLRRGAEDKMLAERACREFEMGSWAKDALARYVRKQVAIRE